MNIKKYIVGALLVIITSIYIYVFVSDRQKRQQFETAFAAIPERSSAFIYIEDLNTLKSKLDSLSYKTKLASSRFVQVAQRSISINQFLLDSLKPLLPKYIDISLTINHIGAGKLGCLNTLRFEDKVNLKRLTKHLKSKTFKLKSYNYQNIKIFSVAGLDKDILHITIYNNLLLFSTNAPLLEAGLNALMNKKSKQQDQRFIALLQRKDSLADFHLFVDHAQNDIYNIIQKNKTRETDSTLKKIREWSYLSIFLEEENINFEVKFSHFNVNETSLKNLIKSEPRPFTLANVLPNNTAVFEAICSKNNRGFNCQEPAFANIRPWLAGEAAFFCLESFDEDYKKRAGFVLRTKNIDSAKINMYLLNKEMEPIDDFEGVAIYEMNSKAISTVFTSPWFSLDKPYFIFINKSIFFANELNVLKTIIQKTKENKFLKDDPHFRFYQEDDATKYIYINPQRFVAALENIFVKEVLPEEMGVIKMKYFKKNHEIFARGNINFQDNANKKSKKIWTTLLDTTSHFKPQLVLNADNLRREVFTQDDKHTLYLINQSGDVIFKKAFKEKIESDVYQIDLHKANKLYYVFNTKTHIYVMKRNGAVLDGYPIKLPAQASNAMLVVNYDNAKEYRFFVACINEKIYGYHANGKPLKGWSPLANTYGMVSSQISHRMHNDKDYIYFNNSEGTFFAFNRKGEKRFEGVDLETSFLNAFESHKDGFINFSKGSVYSIDFNGNISIKIVGDSSLIHFTNYESKNAFAIASEKEFRVAKSKWTLLGKKSFNDKIERIKSVRFSNKTWFLVESNTASYLMNDLGEMHKDFPKLASAMARLTTFYSISNKVLLVQNGNKLEAFALAALD